MPVWPVRSAARQPAGLRSSGTATPDGPSRGACTSGYPAGSEESLLASLRASDGMAGRYGYAAALGRDREFGQWRSGHWHGTMRHVRCLRLQSLAKPAFGPAPFAEPNDCLCQVARVRPAEVTGSNRCITEIAMDFAVAAPRNPAVTEVRISLSSRRDHRTHTALRPGGLSVPEQNLPAVPCGDQGSRGYARWRHSTFEARPPPLLIHVHRKDRVARNHASVLAPIADRASQFSVGQFGGVAGKVGHDGAPMFMAAIVRPLEIAPAKKLHPTPDTRGVRAFGAPRGGGSSHRGDAWRAGAGSDKAITMEARAE